MKAHKDDPNVRVVGVYSKGSNWDEEHIPGSVKIDRVKDLRDPYSYPPNALPTADNFEQVMARAGIDNDTTVVVYGNKWQFSSKLAFALEYFGHDVSKIKILDGGINAWKTAGEPVTMEKISLKAMKPYKATIAHPDIVATRGDISANIHMSYSKNNVLVDVRPLKEWNGTKNRGVRSGNIPDAIHHEGVAEFMHVKSFKFRTDVDAMLAELAAKGITKDKDVYVYCWGGARSMHGYTVFKHILGFPKVHAYVQGWWEWNSLPGLKVEDGEWLYAKGK